MRRKRRRRTVGSRRIESAQCWTPALVAAVHGYSSVAPSLEVAALRWLLAHPWPPDAPFPILHWPSSRKGPYLLGAGSGCLQRRNTP